MKPFIIETMHEPNNRILIIFSTLILFLFSIADCKAQTKTSTIQEVYEQFSRAYKTLDIPLLKSLYAEKSYYLTANPESAIGTGNDEIVNSIGGLFKRAQERGTSIKITFKIINREVKGDLAYDVGYYKFEAFPKDGNPVQSAGKFATVLKKNDLGNWKFVVDAMSETPVSAFEEANPYQKN